MLLISRYLTREVFATLIAVTLVLLLIFLSNQLVRYLSYAASGKIAASILLQLMGFSIPALLALLLPLGLYLGIILAYGRFYAENEMRVMQIGGFTTQHLFLVTGLFALGITIIVSVLMLWINPSIAEQRDQLIAKNSAMDAIFETLLPGRFQVSLDGRRVVYVEQIARNHKSAKNVFIAEQKPNNMGWAVLSAEQGSQYVDHATQDHFMVATEGNRYDGAPGQNQYKLIQFKKYAVRAPDAPINTKSQEEVLPTTLLWEKYQDPANAAELQWRLSIALSTFLLALMAIPLSHVKPRQGRFAPLFPAILIYVVYVNLLFVARHWVEQRLVPVSFGMWWTHALLLVLILFLIGFAQREWLRKTS